MDLNQRKQRCRAFRTLNQRICSTRLAVRPWKSRRLKINTIIVVIIETVSRAVAEDIGRSGLALFLYLGLVRLSQITAGSERNRSTNFGQRSRTLKEGIKENNVSFSVEGAADRIMNIVAKRSKLIESVND